MIAAAATPALQIDLTSCEREPIHLGGMIQAVGFLIMVSADWMIARVSANAPQFLGHALDEMLGRPLGSILRADAIHTIRNRLSMVVGESSVERAFGVQLQNDGPLFDLALHFLGPSIILEAEPSEPQGNFNSGLVVRSMVERLQLPQTLGHVIREAARQVRALTGFDRVMVYRFHPDDTGEVVAESLSAGTPSFLGLRFPASDIPVQARALYVKNPLRLIADVGAADVPIEPRFDALGKPVDLTMSVLRAVAPVHIQYLRNMGVQASMSVSIVRGGVLWGLIACHHLRPRQVGFERRTTLELFVQMFSLLLERRERAESMECRARARLLHSQLLVTMASQGSHAENLAGLAEHMGELLPHDGVGIWADGEVRLSGSTPTAVEFAELVDTLNRGIANTVYATADISAMHAPAAAFAGRAAGLLAVPISRVPRDYLVFFRREVAASVIWAGNPDKTATITEDTLQLSPRASFDAWRQIVRGQSVPWSDDERATAEEMRIASLEAAPQTIGIQSEDRRGSAPRHNLMIAELNHRVRNILGLVKGLVSQSGATEANVAAFRDVLSARVQSLARAHDQITAQSWNASSLGGLIAVEADAYNASRPGCIVIRGPEVLVEPRAFTTVALVVHELTTNSVKYGAIGSPAGVTTVEWVIDQAGGCVVTWQERGGPLVRTPTRRGFGSTIIERSIAHDLSGTCRIDYDEVGITACFVLPAVFVSIDTRPAQIVEMPAPVSIGRIEGAVLLVEDNMIIALDAETILLSLGASRVDIAGSETEAMRLIETSPPDLALLDVNLGIGTSFAVAARLCELHIPIVYATGFGGAFSRPPGTEHAKVVSKPYSSAAIGRAVQETSLRIPQRG